MRKCKDFLNELIVTCLYVGKIKYAPGTFGSLLAFPVSYMMIFLAIFSTSIIKVNPSFGLLIFFGLLLVVIIAAFILGVTSSNIYIKNTRRQDPKEIVIDELVGQMLVIFLCLPSFSFLEDMGLLFYYLDDPKIKIEIFMCLFLMPFALFRFFDIKKPWPIDWIDKNIKNGFGVMLDDIAAALFAIVMHYVLLFVWIDLVR